jgi:ubiquinone/menaquinone biosynthesis C-methylase UbiE
MAAPGPDRTRARALCAEYSARSDALGWFEALYREAGEGRAVVPWADLVPNPHLVDWHARAGYAFQGKRCLKVGCGFGDDAEYLARAGADVVAFDIAPTAIARCRERFPATSVEYVAADVLDPPRAWSEQFDFVLEAYTLQVLPSELRPNALRNLARFVKLGATLLVICRGRDAADPEGQVPWPLTRTEFGIAPQLGLRVVGFEDFVDQETPPVRRFRIEYARERA